MSVDLQLASADVVIAEQSGWCLLHLSPNYS
jgi:hypothetical protein